MDIQKVYLTPNKWSRPQKGLVGVNAIVIHWVANPGTSAMMNRNYFENRKYGKTNFGSAHFIIGQQGEIIQDLPENEMAYHVGSTVYTQRALAHLGSYPNNRSIGCEMVHKDWDGNPTKETYESTIKLAAHLLKKYGLDESDLWLHYEVVGWKRCHKLYTDNNSKWIQFKKDVARVLHGKEVEIYDINPGEMTYVSYLAEGDNGSKVKELQELLLKAGEKLPKFGADSDFGQETEDAVISFQKKHGLAQDGLAGEKTMAKLKEVTAPKSSSKAKVKKINDDNKYITVKVNDLHTYNTYDWDAKKGAPIVNKGDVFTVTAEYEVSGSRMYKLKSGYFITAAPEYVEDKKKSEPKPKPKPTPKPVNDGKAIVPYPGLLKVGSRGKDVERVQRAVGASVDGIFGNGTKSKVMAYQKRMGLQVDGLVGRNTWYMMF